MKKAILFAIAGFIIGIPISYWFQPKIIRAKLSLTDYIKTIPDFFSGQDSSNAFGDFSGNLILSCVIFAVLFGVIGYLLDKKDERIKD